MKIVLAYALGLLVLLMVLCFALKVAATCKMETESCTTDVRPQLSVTDFPTR